MTKDEMIDIIDNKLDEFFKRMELSEYRYMIKHNYPLNWYDHILGRIDIGMYPNFFKIFVTKGQMNRIIEFLDDKIKEY